MDRLDPEEQELSDSFDRDEWRSVPDREQETERYRESAQSTFKKDMRVNIRISKRDLDGLQSPPLEGVIPYQTLMSSVLHKYIGGRLVDKPI